MDPLKFRRQTTSWNICLLFSEQGAILLAVVLSQYTRATVHTLH